MAKNDKRKGKSEIEQGLGNLEESLTRTEQFIEKNQKVIIIVVIAVVAIVLGIFGFNKFHKAPKEQQALEAMYQAEEFFRTEKYQLALDGINEVGKQVPGFIEIIDDFGSTKAGNLAKYYAGISYKNLGEYEKAITYLDKFDSDDFLLQSIAISAKGDALFELGKYEEAGTLYEKASTINPNEFTTPIYLQRAGLAYEEAKNFDKAIKVYSQLKNKYPFSIEGREVEKYLTRAKLAK